MRANNKFTGRNASSPIGLGLEGTLIVNCRIEAVATGVENVLLDTGSISLGTHAAGMLVEPASTAGCVKKAVHGTPPALDYAKAYGILAAGNDDYDGIGTGPSQVPVVFGQCRINTDYEDGSLTSAAPFTKVTVSSSTDAHFGVYTEGAGKQYLGFVGPDGATTRGVDIIFRGV